MSQSLSRCYLHCPSTLFKMSLHVFGPWGYRGLGLLSAREFLFFPLLSCVREVYQRFDATKRLSRYHKGNIMIVVTDLWNSSIRISRYRRQPKQTLESAPFFFNFPVTNVLCKLNTTVDADMRHLDVVLKIGSFDLIGE